MAENNVNNVIVSPVPKKSTDSMSDYINYFERLSLANGWDDVRRAAIFPSLLEIGCKALDGLSDATMASFTLIKRALLGESEPYRESNLANLWHVSRRSNESLTQYKERIAGLVENVYPRFAASNKLLLTRDIFVHSLPNDFQRFLLSISSNKIEEVLNSALMYESMKPKTIDSKPLKDQFVGARKKISDEKCHYCHQKGHYARDCYKKKMHGDRKFPETRRSVDAMTAKYFAALQIGDNIEEMLVDTGAAVSVLPVSRYKAESDSTAKFTLADGSILKSSGILKLPVKTLDGKLLACHQFQVADVNKTYLGADLLEHLNAVINLRDSSIDIGVSQIPLHIGSEGGRNGFQCLENVDFIDDVEFLTGDVPSLEDDDNSQGSYKIDQNVSKELDKLLDSYSNSFTGIG